MFNKRIRTLNNDDELFSVVTETPKYFLTKKNSWNFQSPKNMKKRRHTISCLPSLNVKQIFVDFITTDFDKKLEDHSQNMKSASKKLLLHLHNNPQKIPTFVDNAIINLVILILSNGDKYLSEQQVKHNVHFYLKLAERAIQENDHQTAILIKCAIENYNVYRLKLKRNKTDQKIIDLLEKKYGNFKNCYSDHLREFLEVVQEYDKIYSYIPSAMVLHMHSIRNERYTKEFRRIGKHPTKISQYSQSIELFKKLFYNKNSISGHNLTKLYLDVSDDLKFIKDFDKNNDLKSLLFHLSCNVKNSKQNKLCKIDQSKKSSNRTLYLN